MTSSVCRWIALMALIALALLWSLAGEPPAPAPAPEASPAQEP